MNKDIETLRVIASNSDIPTVDANELRAIADRMEAQEYCDDDEEPINLFPSQPEDALDSVETLRKSADYLETSMIMKRRDCAKKLHSIADRMEQQSKAEPVAQVHILRSGAADFEQFQKIEDGSMLFTHPPADARDAERYRFISTIADVQSAIDHRLGLDSETIEQMGVGIDAAIAAREGK